MYPITIFLATKLLLSPAEVPSNPEEPAAVLLASIHSASEELAENSELTSAPRPRPSILPIPTLEELESEGATIGEIEIRIGDIFDAEDPDENNRIYLTANRLHRTTRKRVVERLLLFQRGDRFSVYRLEESERILRAQGFLYEAEITPIAWDGRTVDLRIETRDVWTLKGGLSVGRSGGTNDTRLSLEDSNFLGTGKEVTLKWTSDVDRSGYLLRYVDPNISGTRAQLELSYADNNDGSLSKVKLRRPFYSLETRRAIGGEFVENDRRDTFYTLGRVSHEFQHTSTFAEIWTGFSSGLVNDHTHRWYTGLTYQRDLFDPTNRPVLQVPFEDRILTYPWIGFESIQYKQLETHDLNLIGRTEDLDLGRRFSTRVGWASELLGGTIDQAVFAADYSFGLMPGPRHLILFDSYSTGRWDRRGLENFWAGANVRYYWRNLGGQHAFFATLGFDSVGNLDPEHQLLLGGDTGLRGYPLRYQDGERRALLTLEQRFYTSWHPFRLAHVGAAVFFDAGRAWTPGQDVATERGTLTDVGLGLRISPSRSGLGTMFHLDVAFPLDADGDIDKVQFLFSTKESF
ncbi:MAG: hypothetical protein KDD47_06625 [Acidobacteria bacterium]|nr:hypothetical protein [Acidobacteriota bacterium]